MKKILTKEGDTLVNSSDKAIVADLPVLETKTGVTLPQTFTAIAAPVQSFKRYGLITQASTPTPDNPVPLMCNCGEIVTSMWERTEDIDGQSQNDLVYPAEYIPETISIHGKNLTSYVLDLTTTGDGTNRGLIPVDYGGIWRCGKLPVQQYTISMKVDYSGTITYSAAGNLIFFAVTYTDDSLNYYGVTNANYTAGSYSFSPDSTKEIKSITVNTHSRWTGGTLRIYDLQVEAGSTATAFEQNASTVDIPPLFASAGGDKDVLDLLTGTRTKYTITYFLNGSEDWSIVSGSGVPQLYNKTAAKAGELIWCTHFGQCEASKTTAQMPNNTVKMHGDTNGYIYFKHPDYINDLSGWITWVEQQYAAGTPVTLVCRRTEPITEAYTDKTDWRTIEGSNTITNYSQISGQTADITYQTA